MRYTRKPARKDTRNLLLNVPAVIVVPLPRPDPLGAMDPKKWAHGQVIQRNDDGTPLYVWDSLKTYQVGDQSMKGGLVSPDQLTPCEEASTDAETQALDALKMRGAP